jgi:hypothetical protein
MRRSSSTTKARTGGDLFSDVPDDSDDLGIGKDFFFTARFEKNVPGVQGASGGIIMPSGITRDELVRRGLDDSPLRTRLLDPQIYLGDLRPEHCRKACANMASYPWFRAAGVEAFDSSKVKRHEWKQAQRQGIPEAWRPTPTDQKEIEGVVTSCVEFQLDLDCEMVILPSPLTRSHATDYGRELQWLETGLAAGGTLVKDRRVLATVAISDTCLRGFDPLQNDLLGLILDSVTARVTSGVYLVLEQSNETKYYCTSPRTVGSILRLAEGLKQGGIEYVLVSFAGVAGLLSLLVGADGWSTGWYRGERLLNLVDFQDKRGSARPAYYSHPLAAEIHVPDDIDKVVQAGFLNAIADETAPSASLLAALRSPDQSYKKAIGWNTASVASARAHFAQAMIRETRTIAGLDEAGRRKYGVDWLRGAADLASQMYGIGGLNPRTEIDHQRGWKEALESQLASDQA